MLELFFFILGFVNNLFLITIFLIRKNRLTILKRIGWVYFLLAIPAAYGIFYCLEEQASIQFVTFLAIFIAFLAIEWLLDFALKINFREHWKRNWKITTPYLCLYYAMNYGFVVMPWKTSLAWGIIMLLLAIMQIITNIRSHSGTAATKNVAL